MNTWGIPQNVNTVVNIVAAAPLGAVNN